MAYGWRSGWNPVKTASELQNIRWPHQQTGAVQWGDAQTIPVNTFEIGEFLSRIFEFFEASNTSKLPIIETPSKSISSTGLEISTTSESRTLRDFQAHARFDNAILSSLAAEQVEDGHSHAAEEILESTMASYGFVAEWTQLLFRDRIHRKMTSVAADLLICVGRLPLAKSMPWGRSMAATALRLDDLELREAAVYAVESWGGAEELELLRNHSEEVDWLAEYIQQVLDHTDTAAVRHSWTS